MEYSTFEKDLVCGNRLEEVLFEVFFKEYLDFLFGTTSERILFTKDKCKQYLGEDVVVTNRDGRKIFIDIKCQTNEYIGNPTPTFCLELSYLKNGEERVGWFLDSKNNTDYYMFVWIYKANGSDFLRKEDLKEAEIALVLKRDIKRFLLDNGIGGRTLSKDMKELRSSKEWKKSYGRFYMHLSTRKAEKPINLVFYKMIYFSLPHTRRYFYNGKQIIRIPNRL